MASRNSKNSADVRKLLKQKRTGAVQSATHVDNEPTKRVSSPLARYDNVGRLSCVVCNVPVKTEALWTSHLAGKSHKDAVARLKAAASAPAAPTTASKRALSHQRTEDEAGEEGEEEGGRRRLGLGSGGGSPAAVVEPHRKRVKVAAGSMPPPSAVPPPRSGLVSSDPKFQPEEAESKQGRSGSSTGTKVNQEEEASAGDALPADFFDGDPASVVAQNEMDGAGEQSELPPDFFDELPPEAATVGATTTNAPAKEEPDKSATGGVLPSDFFDNPDAAPQGLLAPDARAAQTEAAMDAEWAAFQKSITQTSHKNELLAREEVEVSAKERVEAEQLEEEDYRDRLARLKKLKTLVFEGRDEVIGEAQSNARAAAKSASAAAENSIESSDSGSDDSEDDINALLDWRTQTIR